MRGANLRALHGYLAAGMDLFSRRIVGTRARRRADGRAAPTAARHAHSLRSGHVVRPRRVAALLPLKSARAEYESEGQLLGQRRRRVVLQQLFSARIPASQVSVLVDLFLIRCFFKLIGRRPRPARGCGSSGTNYEYCYPRFPGASTDDRRADCGQSRADDRRLCHVSRGSRDGSASARLVRALVRPGACVTDAAEALGREDIDAFLYVMGRSIGPPWQAKHKRAAAAAPAALGDTTLR